MLTTTQKINETTENVICYFSNLLVIEFTHTVQGNMHTFERSRHELTYAYPLHTSDHHAMVMTTFGNSYSAADVALIYQAIARDYKRLLTQAHQAVEMGG